MLKKFILTSALCIVLTGGIAVASATAQEEAQTPQTEVVISQSEETIEEAEPAEAEEEISAKEKLSQEEKARNLQEKDSFGGALTIMSMCIVLLALIILSILFLGFGKISSKIQSRKKLEARGINQEAETEDHDNLDSGEVIAAIAMALDEHFGGKHDIENTILTLRRMKRAYSPWNSKIYNLREVPQVRHHAVKISPAKNIK